MDIILDYDGTLVDTNELLAHGLKTAVEFIFGKSPAFDRYPWRGDMSTTEQMMDLGLPAKHADAVRKLKFQVYMNLFTEWTKPDQKLVSRLWNLWLQGHRFYVCSNSPTQAVALGLSAHSLDFPIVGAACCGDQVPPGRGKPHPDLYDRMLRVLQLNRKEVLVFEDSEVGLAAAKAAGIANVIPTSYKTLKEDLEHALSDRARCG